VMEMWIAATEPMNKTARVRSIHFVIIARRNLIGYLDTRLFAFSLVLILILAYTG